MCDWGQEFLSNRERVSADLKIGMGMETDKRDRDFFVASMFELALAGAAILLGRFIGVSPYIMMPRFGEIARIWEGVWLGGLFGGGVLLLAFFVGRFKISWIEQAALKAEIGLKPLLRECNYGHVIAISLAAGVGEEMLFRGWLLSSLLNWFGGSAVSATVSIFLSSLLFGLAHPITRGYVLIAASIGLGFGAMYLWSGNLLTVIMAHSIYDAVLLSVMLHKIRDRD